MIDIKDAHDNIVARKKVLVWNATVANITLMALGSSAPEILLALMETVTKLDNCPGQLGAATIVGSAAFNLFVISGVSIYAVHEENDNDPERDDTVEKGVKKINDMGVFSITACFSIFAYVWMFICLQDQNVSVWEAWVTFAFFFILIGTAYAADRWKAYRDSKEGDGEEENLIQQADWTALEMYKNLIADKKGEKAANDEEHEKRQCMKCFLKEHMKTD